jgi:hypothetical protein
MGLPKLDEVVGVIVEEAEDAAPLGHTIIPENVVNSEPATNVETTTEEEEEEEELSATDRKQLAEAQTLLYIDWSTRDTLLDD